MVGAWRQAALDRSIPDADAFAALGSDAVRCARRVGRLEIGVCDRDVLGDRLRRESGEADIDAQRLVGVTVDQEESDGLAVVILVGQPLIGSNGYWTASDICTPEFQSACQAAGISG